MALHGGFKSRRLKVNPSPCQEAENDFYVPFDHLNRRFIDLKKFAFSSGQEEKNDFKFPIAYLNHLFFDVTQLAIWAGQVVENEFAMPCKQF